MLLIVRPSAEGINAYAALPLLAVCFFLVRDLATRRLRAVPSTMVAMCAATAITLSHGAVVHFTPSAHTPEPHELALLATCSVLITGAYLGNVVMMRTGDAAFVQPFRYTLLIWSTLLGVLLFGDWPDGLTVLGGSLIAGSGIYSLHCEAVRTRSVTCDSTRSDGDGEVRPSEQPTEALKPGDSLAAEVGTGSGKEGQVP